MAKTNLWMWGFVAIVLVAVVLGGYSMLSKSAYAAPPSGGGSAPPTGAGTAALCGTTQLFWQDCSCSGGDVATRTAQQGAYDYDKQGTSAAPTQQYNFKNAATGLLNSGNTTVSPGQKYTYLAMRANWFSAMQDFTVGCDDASPSVDVRMKQADTAAVESVINSDQLTANTATANESLVASGAKTLYLRLTPSALYKHKAGVNNPKMTFWINVTNATDWDASGFDMKNFDGTACVRTSQPTPTAITKGVTIVGFDCNGDPFPGNDMAYKQYAVTVKSGSLAAVAWQGITIQYTGWTEYLDTISGAVKYGAVKNDGTATNIALETATMNFN